VWRVGVRRFCSLRLRFPGYGYGCVCMGYPHPVLMSFTPLTEDYRLNSAGYAEIY
jgi:hypothetical protein